QNLPHFVRSVQQLDDIRRGGYVLAGGDGPAAITLLATGSEVDLAMRARETLAAEGIAARVVSMPNCAEFDRQTPAYRGAVLARLHGLRRRCARHRSLRRVGSRGAGSGGARPYARGGV